MVTLKRNISLLFAIVLPFIKVSNAAVLTCASPTDSTHHLHLVTIKITRLLSVFTGTKLAETDTAVLKFYQQQSLAELLASQSQIFIKSYGPGMLSTASFRGGNASHTPVVWNGFNLQNPLNGQTDFSLIPAFLMEGVVIQYGSPGVQFGSGTLGGAVHLQTKALNYKEPKLKVMLANASYNNYAAGLKTNFHIKGIKIKEGVFFQKSENNFAYYETNLLQPGTIIIPSEVTRASHASYNQFTWIQEIENDNHKKHQWGIRSWINSTNRQIPEASMSVPVQGYREDRQIKIAADYKLKHKQYEGILRTAYLNDKLMYQDLVNGTSYTTGNQSISYFDNNFNLKKSTILVSLINHWLQANGTIWQNNQTYNLNQTQLRQAIFGSIRFNTPFHLTHQFAMRVEWVDGKLIPLIPTYGFQWWQGRIGIMGNVARSYRLPTFNDLYWPQMGNPNLLPEEGWNYELSFQAKPKLAYNIIAQITITGYYKNIQNWILWVPKGGNLSTPMNVLTVSSKGFEGQWSLKKSWSKIHLQLSGLHDINMASPTESKLPADSSVGKQLIYAPGIKHQLNAQVFFRNFHLLYNFSYTGIRYVSSDHTSWLNPFQLHAIGAGYKYKNLSLQFQIQNLFNTTYQVMVNRPMPLANYQLQLFYTL